jgi:hypothetical protein
MAFNIQNFASNINRYGTLQTNRFEVRFSPPIGLISTFGRDTSELLSFRAENIKMPGVNFANYESRRYGVGPTVKSPTNVQFSDIDVSFIEAENQEVFDIFYQWSNLIVNYSDPFTGEFGLDRQIYTTSYKDSFISNIQIRVFNNSGTNKFVPNIPPELKPTGIIELTEAFPISVSDSALSWSDNNSLFKVNVQFAFTNWRFKRTT